MAGPGQHKGDSGHHASIEIEIEEGGFVETKDDSDSTYHDARGTIQDQGQRPVSSEHEIIEIEEHPNKVFVESIKLKVKRAFPSLVSCKYSCIYRVHEKFHQMNDRAYTPEVVSIGPLHHKRREGNLQAMEECKLLYMYALLTRTAKAKYKDCAEFTETKEIAPVENKEALAHKNSEASTIGSSLSTKFEESDGSIRPIRRTEEAALSARKGNPDPKRTGWLTILEECGASIRKIEKKARRCYAETIDLNSNEFVEMMLIDGLFIIELFRKGTEEKKGRYDPLFGKIGSLSSLTGDLLLLENQLPMIVLDCLFKVPALAKQLQGSSLNMLILSFFNHLMPRDEKVLEKYSKVEANHLLDLLANTFHPLVQCADKRNDSWKSVPSVTELRRSGIRFAKRSTTASFLDIEFKDGVLEIPPVIIQDKTDLLFRNLIASEQCSDGLVTYMTSYAFFMDGLIDTPQDVELLRNEGIITNYLGSDEEVSDLFNKLCREVIIDNFYYSVQCDQLIKHYKKRKHRWQATLKRDYFHSPFAIISFFAASLLIVLTLTATIFAPLSFFIHKS